MIPENYNWLTNLPIRNFQDKSIILIGTGPMAKEYAIAFKKMNIHNVTVISKIEKETTDFSTSFDFKVLHGGYKKHLPTLPKSDLVVIVTPIPQLLDTAQIAIDSGQTNILIEKPGSLYSDELLSFSKQLTTQTVRIGYNRLLYPSFHKLKSIVKEERITSCHFDFTDWVHTIDFKKYPSNVYSRWGISNSLHLISMAMELIGMPKILTPHNFGSLDWHPSGSIFTGSGISEKNILFSYNADWESAGRWGIELKTTENTYRLIPLEGLFVCHKKSVNWEEIQLDISYPDVKPGIAEEIAAMLTDDKDFGLITLEKASEYNKLAEKILNYK
jgi:predicted dehydrogenase